MDTPNIKMNDVSPRWVMMTKDGKTMWLDLVDGKFEYGGNLEPTDGACMFLDELGHLLNDRIEEAAKKLAAK